MQVTEAWVKKVGKVSGDWEKKRHSRSDTRTVMVGLWYFGSDEDAITFYIKTIQ